MPYVDRERVLGDLIEAPVVLIEAGGGFGKSVLADQLRGRLDIASAVAELERDTEHAEQLVGALRRGMRRAGLSDVASALGGASADEIEDAFARATEPLLLVVEEVQHATGSAAAVLAGIARRLDHGHRLVLVGRRLDPQLAALRASAGRRLPVGRRARLRRGRARPGARRCARARPDRG